jgi:hypothetical protein
MSFTKDGITYNGLGEPLPWEAEGANPNSPKNTEMEDKLAQLRGLWRVAKKANNFRWMELIENDAKKLKALYGID